MLHSAEIFFSQRGVEIRMFLLLSQPFKKQYSKKTTMAVKIKLKVWDFLTKKNSTRSYVILRGGDFRNQLSP
jgi:hypothetical protein